MESQKAFLLLFQNITRIFFLSLFSPLGIFLSYKRFKSDIEEVLPRPGFRDAFFLFLFPSSGKISKYMLPVLPAIAVITSLALGEENKYNRIILIFLALFFRREFREGFFIKRDLYPEFNFERKWFWHSLQFWIGLLLLGKKEDCVFLHCNLLISGN